jgi:molecular chaperone DnaK
MEDLKKASAGTDVTAINHAMDALTKAQHAAAENLYKQAQTGAAGGGGDQAGGGAPGGEAGPPPGGGAQGDVIDAEVVDEK